jgi:hypothetical protein
MIKRLLRTVMEFVHVEFRARSKIEIERKASIEINLFITTPNYYNNFV